MSRANSIQSFISSILDRDNNANTPDEAVEAAFLFQRNWASFAFPRYLRALDLIQRSVFSQLSMTSGDYSLYEFQVENLFLPPEIPAFEEYGVPVQVGVKIQDYLVLGEGLDRAIDSLLKLPLDRTVLSAFECEIVEDARSAL